MDKEKEDRLRYLKQGYSKYGPNMFVYYYGYKALKELTCLMIAKELEEKHE